MSVDSLNNLYLNANLEVWKSSKNDDNVSTNRSDSSCEFKRDIPLNKYDLDLKTQIIDESVANSRAQLRGIILQAERKDNGQSLFINIVANEKIGKPSFSCGKRNSKSFQWKIPHLISEPRHELSLQSLAECAQHKSLLQKAGNDNILIYGVVVNPVCIAISKENVNLKNNLVQTAIHGIEQKFSITLCKFNFKLSECDSTKLILNKKNEGQEVENNDISLNHYLKKEKFDDEDNNKPRPRSNEYNDAEVLKEHICNEKIQNAECSFDNQKLDKVSQELMQRDSVLTDNNDREIIPEYKLKYVSHSSLQDYSIFNRYILNVRKPEILALDVKLPGVSKASNINAKVVSEEFILRTTNDCHYFLKVSLPYEVKEEPVKANFDIVSGLLSLEFEVKSQTINSDISPTLSTDSGIECESEYRTSSDGDNSSISSQEECDNQTTATSDKSETKDKQKLGLFNLAQENTDKFLLSPLTISQNENLLFVTIACPNIVENSVQLIAQNSEHFSFKYLTSGSGYASICYGAIVYVKSYSFKQESLTWTTEENDLLIQVEKKPSSIWKEVYIGINLNNLSAYNVAASYSNDKLSEVLFSNSGCSLDSKATSSTEELTENCSETEKVDIYHKKSESVKISRSRCTSDCFVTGSWPKGILKGRSRSLSDSQVDSSWVFGSFTELEDEVLEEDEDEDELYTQSGNESPTAKKSVRFNDFISKQEFKSDASILGQRAKNQKKALQKKRSRERKLSEGNSSMHSHSEQSDATATTTEDDSNTEGEATDSQGTYHKATDKTNRKMKNKKGKSKKGRKVPNLSNDLIFQLDES